MAEGILVLYMPVLHRGYLELLDSLSAFSVKVCLISHEYASQLQQNLVKDIRAVPVNRLIRGLSAMGNFSKLDFCTIESDDHLKYLLSQCKTLHCVDDDLSEIILERTAFKGPVVTHSVFLRWDSKNVLTRHPAEYGSEITTDRLAQSMIQLASKESLKTSDWWRSVGAVVARNGEVLSLGYNCHQPTQHAPYVLGDPRVFLIPGEYPELSTALHAEIMALAIASKSGSLVGCDIFVTTFPCVSCANALVAFGIQRCYFRDGHSSLNGNEILQQGGISVYRVVDE